MTSNDLDSNPICPECKTGGIRTASNTIYGLTYTLECGHQVMPNQDRGQMIETTDDKGKVTKKMDDRLYLLV